MKSNVEVRMEGTEVLPKAGEKYVLPMFMDIVGALHNSWWLKMVT